MSQIPVYLLTYTMAQLSGCHESNIMFINYLGAI